MPRIVQDTLQVTLPATREDGSNEWASVDSAQERGNLLRRGVQGVASRYNEMPPGMNFDAQTKVQYNNAPEVTAAEGFDASDFQRGFRRSGAPARADGSPLFYGDVTVDGSRGYVERGNLLDRL